MGSHFLSPREFFSSRVRSGKGGKRPQRPSPLFPPLSVGEKKSPFLESGKDRSFSFPREKRETQPAERGEEFSPPPPLPSQKVEPSPVRKETFPPLFFIHETDLPLIWEKEARLSPLFFSQIRQIMTRWAPPFCAFAGKTTAPFPCRNGTYSLPPHDSYKSPPPSSPLIECLGKCYNPSPGVGSVVSSYLT